MLSAAGVAYYALSKPGGRPILWLPLLVSTGAMIAAGIITSAPVYWAAREKRIEFDRSQEESNSERLREALQEIVVELEILADANNELVAAPQHARAEYVGRFKQSIVEGAVRATRAVYVAKVPVRAIFIEYDEALDERIRQEQGATPGKNSPHKSPFTVLAFAGKPPPSNLNLDTDDDFCDYARKFLTEEAAPFFLADKSEKGTEKSQLRFPDEADHYIRARVASGQRKFGLICIDIWHTDPPNRAEIEPIVLMLVKLLGAAIAVGRSTLPGSSQ